MNKDKTKKVVSITIIAVMVALVLVTIILAVVPKRFEDPILSNYSTITVYKDNLSQQYYYTPNATEKSQKTNNEIFEKIGQLHKESLKDSVLSALFQGTGSFNVRVENNSISNTIQTVIGSSGENVALVFTYLDEEPQVLQINGKPYRDTSRINQDIVKFNMIVMPINTSDSFEETTIYLLDSASSSNTSSYQVKFLSHQKDLYNYIKDLTFPVV